MPHTWDRITPAEEVVRTLDDLARAGKIRYAGLSDLPGWYAARAQTYAETHALTPMISLQLPYSLVAREIEPAFIPMAETLGRERLPGQAPAPRWLVANRCGTSPGNGNGPSPGWW